MKHCLYYDSGTGVAALFAAAIRLKKLRGDVLPSVETVTAFLRDHDKVRPKGDVHLLGELRGERIYWCGLGRSATIAVRTWRHFLHLYEERQEDYFFYQVPSPENRRWKRGERLLNKPGQREKARRYLAEAAVKEYAVFLTVLMTDWQEG